MKDGADRTVECGGWASEATAAMKLLAACLPVDRTGQVAAERVRAAAVGIGDWTLLLRLGGQHGMLPLLAAAVAQVETGAVPGSVREELAGYALRHARSGLRTLGTLKELQGYFRRTGLEVVAWKGPALAVELFGRASLRECADLDFLLREERVPEAVEVLAYLGFTRHRKSERAGVSRRIARLDAELCFRRQADGAYVELHTRVLPARFAHWQPMGELMERCVSRALGGTAETRGLEPGDLLVSLCGHAIKHHWSKLKWLADVAMFLRVYGAEGLAWEAFVERERGRGRLQAVAHACGLAARVFGVEVPAALLARVGTPQAEALTAATAGWMLAGAAEPMGHAETSRQLALLVPGRLAYLRLSLRRLWEPNLVDVSGNAPGLVPLAKLRRLRTQYGYGGMVEKTLESWRALP